MVLERKVLETSLFEYPKYYVLGEKWEKNAYAILSGGLEMSLNVDDILTGTLLGLSSNLW